MKKPPAFQLYAADFYMDTASWPVEEVGMYTRLLFYQWVNGSIPNDMEKIARITGTLSGRKWATNVARMWSNICHKFVTLPDGNLINQRLEESRQKQEEFTNSRRKGGKKTAEKRWGVKDGDSSANSSGVALQSSSSSSSSKILQESSYDDSSPEVPSAPSEAEPLPEAEIFISIPLVDKTEFQVATSMIEEWRNLYPKVDIEQALRNIRGWNLSHTKERKTRAGILKHITGWLAREQDRGGSNGGRSRQQATGRGSGPVTGTASVAKSDSAPYPVDHKF